MQHSMRLLTAILIIASLSLAACAGPSPTAAHDKPAAVATIQGSSLKQVTLTQKAAERIGIQTIAVREEQATRTRTVGGEVVTLPDTGDTLWVRVRLNESDLNSIDRSQLARIRGLDDEDDGDDGLEAEADEGPEVDDVDDSDNGEGSLYYKLSDNQRGFTPGQRVWVELTLSGSGTTLKVVPYAAVIYDVSGKTWVYTNPEPLVFVRQSISVNYVEGDQAFLSEGPSPGTAVVTVGGPLLYGAEVGVSK